MKITHVCNKIDINILFCRIGFFDLTLHFVCEDDGDGGDFVGMGAEVG